MKRNKILILSLVALLCGTLISAQDAAQLKKEFNEIKKNPEYIYGQSSGEDEEKCYEVAYADFLDKLKEYIDAEPLLRNASAVIVDKMQKAVKKISFERYLNCKVVCVYINKNDIKPISQSSIIDTTKVAVPVIINNVVEKETDSVEAQEPEVAPKDIQPTTEKAPETPKPAASNSNPSSSSSAINVGNAKESEILSALAGLGDFSQIISYLNNRKNSNHDIVFKATTQYGSVLNSYWLVFDSSKRLVAVLTKDKALNLLTNATVNPQAYANSPKVWIQIY